MLNAQTILKSFRKEYDLLAQKYTQSLQAKDDLFRNTNRQRFLQKRTGNLLRVKNKEMKEKMRQQKSQSSSLAAAAAAGASTYSAVKNRATVYNPSMPGEKNMTPEEIKEANEAIQRKLSEQENEKNNRPKKQ